MRSRILVSVGALAMAVLWSLSAGVSGQASQEIQRNNAGWAAPRRGELRHAPESRYPPRGVLAGSGYSLRCKMRGVLFRGRPTRSIHILGVTCDEAGAS